MQKQLFVLAVLLSLCSNAYGATYTLGALPVDLLTNIACSASSSGTAASCSWDLIWSAADYASLPGSGDTVVIAPVFTDLITSLTLAINVDVSIDSLTISNNAVVSVAANATLATTAAAAIDAGSTLYTYGRLIVGSTFTVAGTLYVESTASVNASISASATAAIYVGDSTATTTADTYASLTITADSTITGALYLYYAALLTVTNSAELILAASTISVDANVNINTGSQINLDSGSGTWTQAENSTLTLNGAIYVSLLTNLGTVQGSGNITGDFTNEGTISPGNSPGTTYINGDYTQTSSGTYKFEIEGDNDYDQIIVSGKCTRDGILYPDFINGYQPDGSKTYQIILHQSASGSYNLVRGTLDASDFDKFSAVYYSTSTDAVYSSFAHTLAPIKLVGLVSIAAVAYLFL